LPRGVVGLDDHAGRSAEAVPVDRRSGPHVPHQRWLEFAKSGLPTIQGNCTTCHDSPNIGNHSVALPIDIGVSDGSRRTSDMPLYTLQNLQTGETRTTTDPGRALLTGHWKDIGKFKGPVLRGLAARPPYFHNGLAADLGAVVDFYNTRFAIGFTDDEKADLIAFLSAL
jgi:cytochrome c peroxidase